jgi:tetratricopeptide (TPR) repeat protein
LPRHQTLRALIDWSYDLLAREEQLLFTRLGIFAGGFLAAAPSTVCSGNGIDERAILDLLASLVEKSLVTANTSGDETSYTLLESMRDYAVQRLREGGEFDALQHSRVSYFAKFAESAQEQMNDGADVGLRSIEEHLEELRSVLDLTVAQQYDILAGARIANGMARYWHDTGKFAEAYRWYKAILEKGANTLDNKSRGTALLGAGLMSNYLDAFVEARELLEEALETFRRLGDRAQAARCLTGLGVSASYLGQLAEAERLFNECLAIQRELGQERGIAISLVNLGATAQQYRDDPAFAETYFAEALAYARRLNDKPIAARALAQLSLIERDRQNLSRAIELAEENLRICRSLDNRSHVAQALCRLATLHLEEARPVTARAFLKEAVSLLADRIDEGESAELVIAFIRFAAVLTAESQWSSAAELIGFAEQLQTSAQRAESSEDGYRATLLERLTSEISKEALAASISRGRTLTLAQARSILTPSISGQ